MPIAGFEKIQTCDGCGESIELIAPHGTRVTHCGRIECSAKYTKKNAQELLRRREEFEEELRRKESVRAAAIRGGKTLEEAAFA